MNDLQDTITGLVDYLMDTYGITADEAQLILSIYLNKEVFINNLNVFIDNIGAGNNPNGITKGKS